MSFRVRLLPSGKEFTAEKNETVLEAALRSGIALNYSCNTGTCGGCGGRITSGQVSETRQHDFHLSDTQKAQGHVLLCVTAAQSDLEIEVKEAGESSWETSTDPVVGRRDMKTAGAAIAADHPDLAGFDVYLTVPESGMELTVPESGMEGIVGLLQRHGLPKGQLRLDVMKRF